MRKVFDLTDGEKEMITQALLEQSNRLDEQASSPHTLSDKARKMMKDRSRKYMQLFAKLSGEAA